MDHQRRLENQIECMLFAAGDPVSIPELARVLELSNAETHRTVCEMERRFREEERGVQLLVTEETAQLVSNKAYIEQVRLLLQPDETRQASASLLETLAVVAYRQPVTRADIEAVRGVRCDYAVGQLLKLGLITAVGRKDVAGRPALFGTTDRFLRRFGLHSLEELPELSALHPPEAENVEV